MKKAFVLGAGAAVLAAPMALAGSGVFERGPGLNINITDDGYNGSFGSMASDSLSIRDPGLIKDINVTIGMSHTWVGDLVFKLVGPTGQVVTLMSRPGYAEVADDGSGCCGNSADFVFANRIGFDDEAAGDAEVLIGNPVSGSYRPNPGAAGGPNLSAFDGTNMLGVWTLYIGDGAGGDLGVLDYWSLTIEYNDVPAPGALALLGAAGLISRRRRRA